MQMMAKREGKPVGARFASVPCPQLRLHHCQRISDDTDSCSSTDAVLSIKFLTILLVVSGAHEETCSRPFI
jgi:hypothetical protein